MTRTCRRSSSRCFGIWVVEADSTIARGWNALSNGGLVEAAVRAKFIALLTRDRLFGESAAQALKLHLDFGIVRVALPQLRASQFLAAFRAAWQTSRIRPAARRMIDWPAA